MNPCGLTAGMSKSSPARYHTANWSGHTASLRKRRLLLIWLDKEMTWLAPHDGSPDHPAAFPDAAIRFCLSIKVLFKLPLMQTAGMVASLLCLAGLDWPAPDFATLCRRQKTLAVQNRYRRADGPLTLRVDIEPASATDGMDVTPATGSKRRCVASSPSESGSPPGTPTDKPPKSASASH